ncbi:unnamed protein product [Peronospora belbahrii]|uniref:Uncharacterized protein n=1 Tax=Peronospora belbahrii TaxID=622444 RepID=A0ABN8D8F8_9STRA|nr:unnamed protein product [Peronospora belbahrii]
MLAICQSVTAQQQVLDTEVKTLSVTHSQSSGMTTMCNFTGSNTSTCIVDNHNRSIYARAWRFVQRRLHLRPRACSCPGAMETTDTVEHTPIPSCEPSKWQRVHMLKELEKYRDCFTETAKQTHTDVRAQPRFRTRVQRNAAQITCYNCGLLFFRPLSVAPDTSAFCGRDCQSTFEYRRDLQDVVNEREHFQAKVHWTRSSEL